MEMLPWKEAAEVGRSFQSL